MFWKDGELCFWDILSKQKRKSTHVSDRLWNPPSSRSAVSNSYEQNKFWHPPTVWMTHISSLKLILTAGKYLIWANKYRNALQYCFRIRLRSENKCVNPYFDAKQANSRRLHLLVAVSRGFLCAILPKSLLVLRWLILRLCSPIMLLKSDVH